MVGEGLPVSDILKEVNSVLYSNTCTDLSASEVFDAPIEEGCQHTDKMAEGGIEPTNRDLMECMNLIRQKLVAVEKKLTAIETLERKVDSFEKELNKIWVSIEDRVKRTDDKVTKVEDRVDSTDIEVAHMASKVSYLEKERNNLKDDVAYLKSQSMRNNLIFTNVPEDNSSGNESAEVTERRLRDHLHEKLKIAKETAESIRFERVHRSPGHPITGKVRTIVAKFTFFKDREMVRNLWKNLSGTRFQMFEQFPPEILEKRRRLVPQMKDARSKGKRAWIAYDTLYIDGKAVRD